MSFDPQGKHLHRSDDPATQEMLQVAEKQQYETVWDRYEKQLPHCKFGSTGICCQNCAMGPCRITPKASTGVCGADADVIVARNIIRAMAAGSAAHSDHGRNLAIILHEIVQGNNKDYKIIDIKKLNSIATKLGITPSQDPHVTAKKVATVALQDFGKQDDQPIRFLAAYAPKKRIELWKNLEKSLYEQTNKKMDIFPRSIDREIVDIMHRTHIGVDNDAISLLIQGVRASLGDGWGGSLIATELQDVLFGTPKMRTTTANLGVIDPKQVNIVVHGHEPTLSEKIVEAAQSKELQDLAKKYGAHGINVVGMCCTGNEILMRHGIPIAGNVLQQELAIMTGLVEAMVVDVQCIYPSLGKIAECFHTQFISTSSQAAFPGALHIQFEEQAATAIAEKIVRQAVETYPKRNKNQAVVPSYKSEAVVGFSVEQILDTLGNTVQPLVDAIVSGKIKGIVGIVGCNTPKVKHDYNHVNIAKELIKRDILVIGTGCWAIAAAKAGLMLLAAQKIASPGLKEICHTLNIPPVLHMGSCVDCSRMLNLATALADHLQLDISDLPLVGSAPEWMSEKAIAIGTYFVASGIPVHLWPAPPVTGSENVTKTLTQDLQNLFGGYFFIEEDPIQAVEQMETIILEKRAQLKI